MNPSNCKRWPVLFLLLLGVLSGPNLCQAQSVAVTVRLDTNQLAVGTSTTLHVLAQVVPSLRASSDRIFSWYVDVLNTNGAAANANYNAMLKTASDNDPQTSSTGTTQGSNRRGIYDTFLNFPGAGVTNPVELMSIPVSGVAVGQTRFLVQAGTGASLSTDFQVAPIGGGQPYVGGDYSAAFADLLVFGSSACVLNLQVTRLLGSGGTGGTLQLTFTPCPGRTHYVEFNAAPNTAAGWQALPGAPHNSGSVIVTNSSVARYFRVRASSP